MLDKRMGKHCRQSPLEKATHWGENALKIIGGARGIYEAGKTVYGAYQAAAPYVSGAMAML